MAPIVKHLEGTYAGVKRPVGRAGAGRAWAGVAGGCLAGLLIWTAPSSAAAQASPSCYPSMASAFARVRSAEAKAITQGQADLEVQNLFGPRPDVCEAGAYKFFMDSFELFTKEAMRAKPASRDKLLRLAIAMARKAPGKVPAAEGDASVRLFRQVKSNLSATADDVGFEKTPLLQQVLDVLAGLGQPTSVAPLVQVDSANPTPQTAPTTTTANGVTTTTQAIKVPTVPLPPWAVIKLYEMRDHIKAQDLAAIQIKLQDIINWMESTTAGQ